jgi:acetyltransferase-like isoleucine patch superfamily enzyme
MKKVRSSMGLPTYAYAVMDLIMFPLSVGPGAVAWGGVAYFLRHFWSHQYFFLWALLAPFVLIFGFIGSVFVLRLLAPRLKKGVFAMGMNAGTLAWAANLALSRASEVAAVRPLLNAFFWTKFLHWRALGMKIDYGVNTSIGVSFVDLPMITIRKGCTISEGVHIACHTFVGDRLFVAPVEIGENVFVGMNCTVGPKTKIGDGAWIGMSNLIGGDIIAEGTKIDSYEWERGNPEKARKKEPAN